jgi:hypothetical protein
MTGEMPYRVVDRENYGWYRAGTRDGRTAWTTGPINGLGFDADDYPALVELRAPVRPVLPINGDDRDKLHALFGQAGRKTIATLAAALEAVFDRLRESLPGGWRAPCSYDYAKRTMMAGRAGSWESAVLIDVILFGNGLNLAKATRQLPEWDVDARRAAGPARRVDKAARDAMAAMFWQWVTGPDRYTELAETLASIVSGYCDDQAKARGLVPDQETLNQTPGVPRPAGWPLVADQWLQPRGLAQADFSLCYRLFYSLSRYFDSSVI